MTIHNALLILLGLEQKITNKKTEEAASILMDILKTEIQDATKCTKIKKEQVKPKKADNGWTDKIYYGYAKVYLDWKKDQNNVQLKVKYVNKIKQIIKERKIKFLNSSSKSIWNTTNEITNRNKSYRNIVYLKQTMVIEHITKKK